MLDFVSMAIIGQEWVFVLVAVLILAIIGIIAIAKMVSKKMPSSNKKRLDLLKDRLAKGEITKDEYDRLKSEFED